MKIIFLKICILIFLNNEADDIFTYKSLDHDSPSLICAKAKYDAASYHGKSDLFFALGFFTGPTGIIFSIIYKPELSANLNYLSKNKILLSNDLYNKCYSETIRQSNIINSIYGFLCSSLLIIIIVLALRYIF